MSDKKTSTWKTFEPFLLGGLAGMGATTIIQPIDMIKVRIQLLGEGGKAVGSKNPFSLGARVISEEGFLSLYSGLSAALLRQATYTTARMGIFRSVSDYLQGDSKAPLPLYKKTIAGLTAGGLGSVFGTPADVALIRMQADRTLPVEQRRNYKGVVDALIRMTREEGLSGLFRGNSPVVLRAMALNVGMLTVYDESRERLKPVFGSQASADVAAKVLSGFCASFFSLPFDFVKTRVQKQKRLPDGTLPYRSFVHCVTRVASEEGVGAFYRGFWTYYVRIAPHAMITLAILDELKKMTKDW